MTWSLYEGERSLEPLRFSNGKTQENIVNEVLDAVSKGGKIIFIRGICGTGKSAIALNIAREIGKASIVVPGKTLQMQYKKDYEGNKYLLKDNKEKLKISVITGRNNHRCKFLEENKNAIPKIVKEMNSKLQDIFDGKREEINEIIKDDISADNMNIPCKIEIKERNWNRIQQYLKQNKEVNIKNFNELKDVRRVAVASVCPYWSPVFPEKFEFKQPSMANAIQKNYCGLTGDFTFYSRRQGCSFYEQFNSYLNSDVIVFNSLKYMLESALGRKPKTEVEIIDECDEFLDSFSNSRTINLDRLQNSLVGNLEVSEKTIDILTEIDSLIKQLKRNERLGNAISSGEIIPLKETGLYDLFKILLKNKEILEEIDEENYLFDVEETARMFEGFIDDSFVTTNKKENNLIVNIETTNLEKKFKEMVNKNKIIVLMSGTLHSEQVLREIFGLTDFKIIEAEVEQQGRIEAERTSLEKDCRYSNFGNGKHNREDYLKAFDKCVENAKRPALVHVNAFADLPSEEEKKRFSLNNLISREELQNRQQEDKNSDDVRKFKKGETDILFSTKASRGVDFPGEECNSIVFTKYPNPNVEDAFWKILNKTRPQHYWNFYKDKARRELWQKVYRGLRFKEDHVFVLSPDSRVLEVFENANQN